MDFVGQRAHADRVPFNRSHADEIPGSTRRTTRDIVGRLRACRGLAGYLGPRRDGTSAEKGLLRTWPKEGPKVLWTAPVGIGYGGPVVSGGKVYLLDRDDAVGDKLRALDFATGKELWSFAYAAPGKFDHPGSRTTPTVDGDNVYTFGPLGDLYCVSTSTHKPVWNKNVWKDFGGGSLPRWALTQNPLDLPQPGDRGRADAAGGRGGL